MMSVEIEMKFIVLPAAVEAIRQVIAPLASHSTPAQALTNIYFETADNTLRQQDMGLRIRGQDQRYEMTLKTAGKVTGGLHQRPEYNVDLANPELDLHLFPAHIWPEDWDLSVLQTQLHPLFRTDFTRETWLIQHGESEIEIALDQGTIAAGDQQETLCEVELELKKGSAADVLELAKQFTALDGLRQGYLSKAARGYRLAQGKTFSECRTLSILAPKTKGSVEQGMVSALTLAAEHWQYHEEIWLNGHAAARESILEALNLVRQTLTIFGGIVPRKASTELRGLLTELEPVIESAEAEAQTVCFSTLYLRTRLALTLWQTLQPWQAFVDKKAQERLNGSFKRFSDIMLGRCSAELKKAFAHNLNDDELHDQLPRLRRNILTLKILSGAYPTEQAMNYIDVWQVLLDHIVANKITWIEALRKQALAQPVFWLNSATHKDAQKS